MVLITLTTGYEWQATSANFRPLAGIMVLIASKASAMMLGRVRHFRPLAGIMVLIAIVYRHMIRYINSHISVPLRGLWFLSTKF